jgi:hypothetical protein
MGRYQFELATRDDDAELRGILAATPMDGKVSLSLRREPSFFDAAVVEGEFHQVMVCRDSRTSRIAGFGCRSVRTLFVNGQPTPIGYLSGLRALPEYRNLGLVARAYALFHQLHADQRTLLYISTIAEGNDRALKMLTSARAGLPTYNFAGTYHSLIIPIRRRRRSRNGASNESGTTVKVRAAKQDDVRQILSFLNMVGAARQFFPRYQASDLFSQSGAFRELDPTDLLLAFRDDKLVGTLGGWDQHPFKQSVVERYASHLRWSRPLYNVFAQLRGLPSLPPVGTSFRYLTAALPVVLDDDPAIFSSLLEHLLVQAAAGPCDFLTIGLHESDPLLPLVQPFQMGCYLTRTYLVCWNDGEILRARLDDRPLYLELGCL